MAPAEKIIPTAISFEIVDDTWLTQIFARPVKRFSCSSGEKVGCGIEAGKRALKSAGSLFAYVKVPVAAVDMVHAVHNLGFRLIDTNVSFERAVRKNSWEGTPALTTRFATADDCAAVATIAEESFRFSRFHLDPAIDTTLANRVKREWVTNFFQGARGDAMVVAERAGQVVGFLQLLYHGETLIIDLIGVEKNMQRQGVGSTMIQFAENACRSKAGSHFERIAVGTQVSNVASVRAYEKDGFRYSGAQYVLHFHSVVG
jgi:dTDP-4-amino-4,6-dideoxy-D-galactose acyltransferase